MLKLLQREEVRRGKLYRCLFSYLKAYHTIHVGIASERNLFQYFQSFGIDCGHNTNLGLKALQTILMINWLLRRHLCSFENKQLNVNYQLTCQFVSTSCDRVLIKIQVNIWFTFIGQSVDDS